jgi:hypothetical protein
LRKMLRRGATAMSISLPSRYEDLDVAFRGHLRPNNELLSQVNAA